MKDLNNYKKKQISYLLICNCIANNKNNLTFTSHFINLEIIVKTVYHFIWWELHYLTSEERIYMLYIFKLNIVKSKYFFQFSKFHSLK